METKKEVEVTEDVKLLNMKFWKDRELINGFKNEEFFEAPFSQLLKTYNGYKEFIYGELKQIAIYFHGWLIRLKYIDIVDGKITVNDDYIKELFDEHVYNRIKINDTVYKIDFKFISYEVNDIPKGQRKRAKRTGKIITKIVTINFAYTLNNNIILTETITIPGYCDNIEGKDIFLAADFRPKRNNECDLLPNCIYDEVAKRTFGENYKYEEEKDVTYRLGINVIRTITYFNHKKDKIKEGAPLIAGLKNVEGFNDDNFVSKTYEEYLKTITPENNSLYFDCFKYAFTTFYDFIDVIIKYNSVINMLEQRENKPEYKESEAMAIETIKGIVLEIDDVLEEMRIPMMLIYDLKPQIKKQLILQLYLRFVGNMESGYDENFVNNLESLIQTLQTYTKDRHNVILSVDNLENGNWLKPYWVTDVGFLLDDEQKIKELTKEDILDEN